MNKKILLVSALAGSLLFTGCVGTGPNTQQGAVTGGALGALAGAIIGNNSRGGNGLAGALIGGTVGAIAGGTLGNSVDAQRGTLYPPPGPYPQAYGYRSYRYSNAVQIAPPPAPPPPVSEVVSAPPAPNALWVPGYWSFTGNGYTWLGGHWEIPPPTARAYVAAHWETRGDHYVYVQSYWR
jgi:hypothetical protein